MVKPEWGLKRTCQSCGARFYDLNHEQIVCPKCDEPSRIGIEREEGGEFKRICKRCGEEL